MSILKTIALVAVACVSIGAHAATPPLAEDDFLQCAAHYAAWAHLLKSNGYDKKDEIQELEDSVQFHLQISEAIHGGRLKERFLKTGDAEMDRTRTLMKSGGYLEYAQRRKAECRALVRDNQAQIMQVMEKTFENAR